MHEGLQLFEEVVRNPIFENTPIFVFLNKKDLFEQMMTEGVPLSRCFPDYRVSLGAVFVKMTATKRTTTTEIILSTTGQKKK